MSVLARFVGRMFFRTVKRIPLLFGALALAGVWFAVWALGFWRAGDWEMVAIGVLCLVFYTGLLVLWCIKPYRGTWAAFCDWGASLFELGSSPATIVAAMNAQVRAHPCPKCGEPLGSKKPGRRTMAQVLWGGWTCPECGCDVDRHGNVRASAAG